ncbi:MAG: DNA cytosine methyltransferase, partial [Actinomycetota bacterium]|nr:DNA cytosine methyltransferase [Actinomycetota bacterium]
MSITVTDLFCGAGGSSLGAELAGATLRLGLNHWRRAIETHATNFQHADHDCEDVASLTTAQIRRYPDSDVLLASPECTNHSLAKGARRRKPQAPSLFEDGPAGDDEQDRSRATMWDVCRFAEQKLNRGRPYKAIIVENVVDAFRWGHNDDGGLFAAWLLALRNLGYEHQTVWLNSMFCPPTPQSRDRMYVVFWRRGSALRISGSNPSPGVPGARASSKVARPSSAPTPRHGGATASSTSTPAPTATARSSPASSPPPPSSTARSRPPPSASARGPSPRTPASGSAAASNDCGASPSPSGSSTGRPPVPSRSPWSPPPPDRT